MNDIFINFVRESNRIEGIERDPTTAEINATHHFVRLPEVTVEGLQGLVSVLQPDAVLRDRLGLNVRVGSHIAPRGCPEIRDALESILFDVKEEADPYRTHCRYETLHPFTDGNGRSGRALWLWQLIDAGHGVPTIGFMHLWYYQSLQAWRK